MALVAACFLTLAVGIDIVLERLVGYELPVGGFPRAVIRYVGTVGVGGIVLAAAHRRLAGIWNIVLAGVHTAQVAQCAVINLLVIKKYAHSHHSTGGKQALIAPSALVELVDIPVECDVVLGIVQIVAARRELGVAVAGVYQHIGEGTAVGFGPAVVIAQQLGTFNHKIHLAVVERAGATGAAVCQAVVAVKALHSLVGISAVARESVHQGQIVDTASVLAHSGVEAPFGNTRYRGDFSTDS